MAALDIKFLNPSKYNRQKAATLKWRDKEYKGTFSAVTGFGKTMVGIMSGLLVRNKISIGVKIDIVVPTEYLKNQWIENCKKYGLNFVGVHIINTFIKHQHECDLLILDEIHKYTGEEFKTVFEVSHYKYILGLTATLDKHDTKYDIVRENAPVFDEVTTEEALANEWISDYTHYCIPVKMSDEEATEYAKINKKAEMFLSTFNHDMEKINLAIKDMFFRKEYAKELGWNEKQIMAHAVNALRYVRQRKDFIYNSISKINLAIELVKSMPQKKIVVFCQTTAVVDYVVQVLTQNGVSAEGYHSNVSTIVVNKFTNEVYAVKEGTLYYVAQSGRKVKWSEIDSKAYVRISKQKQLPEIIDRYKKGETQVLVAAIALDVGMDIPEIDTGISISSTSKPLQTIQRRGRTVRMLEGKKALFIDLYLEGTKDESWLKSKTKSSPNIVVINIQDFMTTELAS